MGELIERADGSLVLPTANDPAIRRAIGWRRFWLGVDLAQAQDWTALVVVSDECAPIWDGGVQALGARKRAIVFADRFRAVAYPDVVSHVIATMTRAPLAGRTHLVIDATGLGRVVSDLLSEARIDHTAIQIVVGQEWRSKGRFVNVGKHALLECLSVRFAASELTIASGLQLHAELMAELETFRLETSRAGNPVITQGQAGHHHGDLSIATACAVFASEHLVPQPIETVKLKGGH